MARKSKLAVENDRLREQLLAQSLAAQQVARQGTAAPGQLFVGLRNISSDTIGIPAPTKEERDIHLSADSGRPDPATMAIMPYSWYLSFRTSKVYRNGMVIRDDRALAGAFAAGPADPPDEPAILANRVEHPELWIDSRTDQQIRDDVALITSFPTLRRLIGVIDAKLRAIQAAYAEDDPDRGQKAYQQLPSKYQMLDNLLLQRMRDEYDPLGDMSNLTFGTIRGAK